MRFRLLMFLFLAGALTASCRKEKPQTARGVYSFSIEAGAPGTRALSLEEPSGVLKAFWTVGETVVVKKGDTEVGVLSPAGTGASTTLSGTLTGTFAQNDELTLHFPGTSVSYSGQKGTLEDIAANFDFASATIRITSVQDDRITAVDTQSGGAADFVNLQAIVRFTLKSRSLPLAASTLTVHVPGTEAIVVNPDSARSEFFVAIPGFSDGDVSLSATVDGTLYTYSKTGVSFSNGTFYPVTVNMSPIENAVDLGLPSGTVWAGTNLGAMNPEDAGDYFAWAEVSGYAASDTHPFNWDNYLYYSLFDGRVNKYDSYDGKTVLDYGDDAASYILGSSWCLPSLEQIRELINSNYTTAEWVNQKRCFRFTSRSNGNSILLPAAGYRYVNESGNDTLVDEGSYGYYWSNERTADDPAYARSLDLYSSGIPNYNKHFRYRGQSLRPVLR